MGALSYFAFLLSLSVLVLGKFDTVVSPPHDAVVLFLHRSSFSGPADTVGDGTETVLLELAELGDPATTPTESSSPGFESDSNDTTGGQRGGDGRGRIGGDGSTERRDSVPGWVKAVTAVKSLFS